ncbi:MAG: TIM44-like domain-containing protein [Planctomycetes bacterium]|nr:TIM44-like domain-containing protein [Planctomycetota bacterium]
MRRRWMLWFLLLFPLIAGVFASELDARFGGGGGYSGGGGGGSGGSGGGGGDGIGALLYLLVRLFIILWNAGPVGKVFAILLLIGVVAGFIWFSKHKQKQRTQLDNQGRILHSHRAQRRQQQGVNQITQFDPNFSRVLFLDFARLVYVKFHESRGGLARRNDSDFAVAPYLSMQIRQQLKQQSATVSEVIVGALEIQRVSLTPNSVQVVVNFRSNVVEATAQGEPIRSFMEQRFTFVRPKSAITQPPEKVLALGCPNCGSPEEPQLDGRCPSCGTITGGGEMDWQVRRIETLRRERVGPPVGHKGGREVGTGAATIYAPDLTAQKRSLAMRDPAFNWVSFNSRATHIFRQLQQAWTDQDEGEMRPYVTDTLFDTVRYWMARYREQGIREVLEDVAITRVEVARIEHDAWFDAITVRIHASMKEYQLDKSGRLISGNKDKLRHFTEYWTLIRRSDRKHGKSAEPANCPSCGAPLDRINRAGICEYCNSKIVGGDFDWVVAIITQDEDYVG